jgi:uncharacterized delta-60 repeat protein
MIFIGLILFTVSTFYGLVQDVPIQEWVARYNGPNVPSNNTANKVAVDSSGSVYVTGQSAGIGTGYDYATIKYDTNGNELWVARYNGPGNSSDVAYAIAVDSFGNVYVTGQSVGIGTNYDYATIKYNTNGNQVWIDRYNGPQNAIDYAYDIAIDEAGSVYVTGYSDYGTATGTRCDYATLKYDTNGNRMWVARYHNTASLGDYIPNDFGRGIAVDQDGYIYVTGLSYGVTQAGGSPTGDIATVKYDTNGNELWVARYNGSGNGLDDAYAIAVDSFGNVYVTGSSYGIGTGYDYATIKYDTNGSELWVARYNGPENFADAALDIAVDSFGNVYVTGRSYGSGPGFDYTTIKYSQFLSVQIDIKPKEYPNIINLGSNGNVPVAILSTANFDATTVDPTTVTLAGADVKLKCNGSPLASLEDVNGDGRLDILVHVNTSAFELTNTDEEAVLYGKTYNGVRIKGVDTIRIVPSSI